MTTLTVSATHIIGTDCGYNIHGDGKAIAIITGNIKPIIKSAKHFGADMVEVDGVAWCIRDVMNMESVTTKIL